MKTINLDAIQQAQKTLKGVSKKTPVARSESLSEKCEGNVYLKLENQQHTGTFKMRGAFNRMSQLSFQERERGVITASSGNHAQGVAYAAQQLDISATIVVPDEVSKAKLEKLQKYDVEIVLGGGFDEVEAKAREMAKTQGRAYISPYNDYSVIAGQGTIGLEIIDEIEHFDMIVVPVGGGGLIAGIAVAVKSLRPDTEVIGVQTEGSSTMYWSWKAGEVLQVEETDTLAEAFLGGVEPGSMTLDVCMEYVDDIVLVDEETVADSIRLLWSEQKQVIEGAGATSISPLLKSPERFYDQTVVCVVSGGNIEHSLFNRIVGGT
ncbi:MAG: threonine/serine dehydratase [Candidatus Thorarchaeota archaeon]